MTHDSERVIVRERLHADGSTSPLPDLRSVGDFDWIGFPLGLEMAIRVGSHLDVTPEVRTILFPLSDSPSPYIIRSGVGLRWRF